MTDKYTKRCLLIPGHSSYITKHWATILVRILIFLNWGLPQAIISDRDRKFLLSFWKSIWRVANIKLLMVIAYYA